MKYIFLVLTIVLLSGCTVPPDPYKPTYNVPNQADVEKYSDAAKKARFYFQEGNYTESFHYAQIAAEQGHADSQAIYTERVWALKKILHKHFTGIKKLPSKISLMPNLI
ncbi:MAG: hypothetical protein R3E61_07955 [Pseudomonadales bacterium]